MASHFLWCHLFIIEFGWGMLGAALATNLTYLLNMILIDFVIVYSPAFNLTRAPLSLTSLFSYWGDYLKIGIPGACMLCFEWWAFELLAVFSGYMGVAALAAEVVIINVVAFLFMMPLGISFAASALTGNYIGQRNIPLAKRFAAMSMLLNVALTTFVVVLMCFFH
jgi:multidrug resistance protein, MATE family